MKTIRVVALLACVLLLCRPADARTVTVRDTLDYTDNLNGYYFWEPNEILDHSPFFRTSLEDWDWTHNMQRLVPADANGIESATLSILAWDVDTEEGEIDIVYVNGMRLGMLQGMPAGEERTWTTTVINLPAQALQQLWSNGIVTIFLDIDRDVVGDRVTLRNSILSVNYTAPGSGDSGGGTDPNATVHRFWSPILSDHVYTIREDERDVLIRDFGPVWTYEGVAYHTFGAAVDPNLRPVYRLWSSTLSSHFYTISEEERDVLIRDFGHLWALEGVAFYAYPEGRQPAGTKPVYRFWSGNLSRHFYTISEQEKQAIIDLYSYSWALEGVAWYAHE